MKQESLNKLLPKFVKHLEDKGRSPSTVLAYRSDLEQLMTYLERKSVVMPNQVKHDNLESFRDDLLAKKYTAKSTSRKLNAIKTFFRWLISEKHLKNDPSKDVGHPKVEPSQPKFLSPVEYRALRDVVRDDKRMKAIVELILQTGMRISEVANLKVEHLEEDHVYIEPYASQSHRKVPLVKAAKDAIQKYLGDHRPDSDHPHVFVSKTGRPLATRNIRAAVDRFMQKAEIPGYSVNDLRTTFIVEHIKRDVDLVTLSQTVGHKRLSTTERYLNMAGREEPGKKQKFEEL